MLLIWGWNMPQINVHEIYSKHTHKHFISDNIFKKQMTFYFVFMCVQVQAQTWSYHQFPVWWWSEYQHIWLWFVRTQHSEHFNHFLLPFLFQWFTLNDIKHGRVHVVLEWLPTSTQRERLDQVSFSWRHTESVDYCFL